MGETTRPTVLPRGIMGYTDRISHLPGAPVRLYVSTEAARWTAELVRVTALEIPSAQVPRRITAVPGAAPVSADGLRQRTHNGSYAVVDDFPAFDGRVTIRLGICPTAPGDGPQGILAHGPATSGWRIGLDAAGRIEFVVGRTALACPTTIVSSTWYAVTAEIDTAAGLARLRVEPSGTFESNRVAVRPHPAWSGSAHLTTTGESHDGPLLWACAGRDADGAPVDCFDGKIEDPEITRVTADAAAATESQVVLARWRIAEGIGYGGLARPSLIHDVSGNARHARTVNNPARGVAASSWRGDVMDFRFAPDQYNALHFHRSDMTDCRWQSQASLSLPQDLHSGVYGAKITDDEGHEDLVPVFVPPGPGRARERLLLVLPTNSYLAYGNDHVGVDSPRTQVWTQMVPTLDDFELFRDSRRDIGRSLYEVHHDGSGVFFSSWRRPLLTMRERVYDHNAPVWQFTGDMQLVDWLDRQGIAHDVITDHDLHHAGVDGLRPYTAVMTGTHPEYPTLEMLQAYESYVDGGGRLLYLGGNGMYWVTGYDPEDSQVIEIRRWGGTQAWRAAPGEYHLSFTGRQAGLWRFAGRPPQKTFGVGFVAAGNPGSGAPYRRLAVPARWGWVFDGIDDELLGTGGTSGGAAGLEIDAVDAREGTPDGTVLVGTSVGHGDDMLEARENFNMTSRVLGGARNPRVHADMVIVPRASGGAVFSAGSIAFAGGLREQGLSRLLRNVLDRFLDPEALGS